VATKLNFLRENGSLPSKNQLQPSQSAIRKRNPYSKDPTSNNVARTDRRSPFDAEEGVTEPLLSQPQPLPPPAGWNPEVLEPGPWPPDDIQAPPYSLAVDETNYPSATGAQTPSQRTSKSLPNSPMKKSHAIPSMPPDDLVEIRRQDNNARPNKNSTGGGNQFEKETVL
jgi:hypothetical protein